MEGRIRIVATGSDNEGGALWHDKSVFSEAQKKNALLPFVASTLFQKVPLLPSWKTIFFINPQKTPTHSTWTTILFEVCPFVSSYVISLHKIYSIGLFFAVFLHLLLLWSFSLQYTTYQGSILYPLTSSIHLYYKKLYKYLIHSNRIGISTPYCILPFFSCHPSKNSLFQSNPLLSLFLHRQPII